MSIKQKLYRIPGGRWAIGRECLTGESIGLIENTAIDGERELRLVLQALALPHTKAILDRYFPKNAQGEHCPTFALMSLWYDLAPATLADTTGKV